MEKYFAPVILEFKYLLKLQAHSHINHTSGAQHWPMADGYHTGQGRSRQHEHHWAPLLGVWY